MWQKGFATFKQWFFPYRSILQKCYGNKWGAHRNQILQNLLLRFVSFSGNICKTLKKEAPLINTYLHWNDCTCLCFVVVCFSVNTLCHNEWHQFEKVPTDHTLTSHLFYFCVFSDCWTLHQGKELYPFIKHQRAGTHSVCDAVQSPPLSPSVSQRWNAGVEP